MKKFTFVAACALTAMAANAQYTVNPETSVVAAQNPTQVAYLALDDESVAELEAKGAVMQYIGPDGAGRNLWVWDNTFVAGDSSYPGVNGLYEYLSLSVGTVGWSGAGYNIRPANDETDEKFEGANFEFMNDETRFHLAYMTSATPPQSIALILFNGDAEGSSPANIALGSNFDDSGSIYTSIAPVANDDWQGIDISFADLKKFSPNFKLAGVENWYGNVLSFLAGGVQGQTFSFDCIYFYNTGEAGVEGIAADNLGFIVTKNTINLNGGNGIELYDLAGKTVKKTSGCVLGIDNLPKGVYVAKSGKLVQKVVVK